MKYAAAIKMPTGVVIYHSGGRHKHRLSPKIEDASFIYSKMEAQHLAEKLANTLTMGLEDEYQALVVSENEVLETEGGSCD